MYQYNPFEAGWLDHTRLRVPKWRKWLEFTSFAILLVLFIATLSCEWEHSAGSGAAFELSDRHSQKPAPS